MGKTGKQRIQEYRERKRQLPGFIEEERKKDRDRKKKKRENLSITGGIDKLCKYEREKKRVQRKERSEKLAQIGSPKRQKMTPSALGKAASRVKRALPHSPGRKTEVLGKIIQSLTPTKRKEVFSMVRITTKFCVQRKKRSDAVSEELKSAVTNFYLRDDISWQSPGMKDYKSVKTDSVRKLHQKRYLLVNLQEAYSIFVKDFATPPLQLTKFKELRPPYVVPITLRDQEVCGCKQHANAEYIHTSLYKTLKDFPQTLADAVNLSVCSTDNEHCVDRACVDCGTYKLEHFFEQIPDEMPVKYLQWGTNSDGRVVQEVVEETMLQVKTEFFNQLKTLPRHIYNAKRQHSELRELKKNLPYNHVIMLQDFAENYSIKHQSEIMAAHWSCLSVTLFTCVVYYRNITGEIQHKSYCVISDSLDHNKDSVHVFNSKILESLSAELSFNIKYVHYFTDGAASQFKSRFLLGDLLFHEMDHGITADRSYFETAHGKGPHDGVGGEVKRVVFRAELQKKITVNSAKEFYEAARNLASSISVIFVPEEEIKIAAENLLNSRWEKCLPVQGLRSVHFACVNNNGMITVTNNSCFSGLETSGKEVCVLVAEESPQTQLSIVNSNLKENTFVLSKFFPEKGHNIFQYACIIQKVISNNEFRVMGMKSVGKNNTIFRAIENDISSISLEDIVEILPYPMVEGTERMRYVFPSPINVIEA